MSRFSTAYNFSTTGNWEKVNIFLSLLHEKSEVLSKTKIMWKLCRDLIYHILCDYMR